MDLGMIGLGKMGANMARRLLRHGHKVIGFNRTDTITNELAGSNNIIPSKSIDDMLNKLISPRIIWLMLPAGEPTEDTVDYLSSRMQKGDYLIDGSNSYYRDTLRRGHLLENIGIKFLDAGVSGGIWGLTEGYSIMIGGTEESVNHIKPILESLAPSPTEGWGRVGEIGSGHFVKMVHNGIEYGLMEAYAEGFDILKSKSQFALDLEQISRIWQKGSVVRSWLLDLINAAISEDKNLEIIKPWVEDSGEGRWTAQEAIDMNIPAPVILASLFRRFESRQTDSYALKLLSAMRNQFGGHKIEEKKPT